MPPIFFADSDSKIGKLKNNGSYPVQNRSGLFLIVRGNSIYFEGRFRRQSCPVGVWHKEIKVDEAMDKWREIKHWCKEHNRLPKQFKEQVSEDPKSFFEIANEFMEEVYKPTTKERTWSDRQNKLNQMLQHIGKDSLISDFELDKGGREKIKKMLKEVFESKGAHYQLMRSRQFLKQIFEFAEEERYIRPNQNPVFKRFQWEGVKHEKKGNANFAKTITSKSWGEVPRFLHSINANAAHGSKITEFAVKAHLLLCIRTGVVVRLQWDWFDAEEDLWVIPSQTPGLKRKLGDEENNHLIPSTAEINALMNQVREITGWQKYVFHSFSSKQESHLGEETINDHLKNLGWHGKQSAHGWRDVITTAAMEHYPKVLYEIIDRQLGRMPHKQGTRGFYDESTLIDQRREFMEWWSKSLVDQGLSL